MNNHVWEQFYKRRGRFFIEPHEFVPKFHRMILQTQPRTLLDIGCGAGRHTVYFANNGFKVTSTDISEEAIKLTEKWLKDKNLESDLRLHNAHENFNFNDNQFDVVLAIDSIIYASLNELKETIEEIIRVTKPSGYVFFAFPTKQTRSHVVQLVFDNQEVEDLLKFRFKTVQSMVDRDNYICIFAENIK